ncbi:MULTISPECIES: lipopolysaccharide biosynthesis protein [Arcicella]|uniref:Polysaccharide biosynthesis C-terminal domain-containing protein n=1 Tax=Arcicella lustrica TaxID=2984196 RepID=A0ABU5SF31_9BACT|nr:polysaccharide biosynthesis C-terminal domain-containing protein [Arcicella sp. DC25W]MEA5425903.1 polysaccharide biosynthesis C-terminal domain-containing protein [Arcicella sp. DC25W]
MSVLKKLASETASYGISTILGRSLNFLLVIVHTAAFLPKELNVNVKLYAYVAIANIIYTYGMETAFFRFAADDKAKYYNIIQSAIIVSSCIFSGILIVFSTPIITALGFPGKEIFLIWISLIVAIDAITAIPFARLRLEKQTKKFVKAKIFNILVNVLLNVIFLLGFKKIAEGDYLLFLQPLAQKLYLPSVGAGYIFLANLLANACFFYFLRAEFKDFKFQFDKAVLKNLLIYAYPIMVMGLASTFNLMFDRILLERLLPEGFYPNRTSQEALGIYGNVYKLSIFMALATQAFRYAAEPFFLAKAEDKNSPETLADVTKWFLITCVFIWLGVCLNLDILKVLFLRKPIYWEGMKVVPILLLANLFLGIYYNISVWFKLNKKTYFGTRITFAGLAITILFNFILIPKMGYMGCAVAFLISCFSMTALCYYFGQKYYPVPYKIFSGFGYIISAGVLIYCTMQIHIENLWISIPYHFLLLSLYTASVVLIERKTIIPLKVRDKYAFLR